jgi:hypothetical protein
MRSVRFLAVALLASTVPTVANAAIVETFGNRSDFLTATSAVSTPSFALGSSYLSPSYSVGALTATTGLGDVFGFDRYISTLFDSDTLVLTFATPITALGLTGGITDQFFSYIGGALAVDVVGSGTTSFASSAGGPNYLGLVSDVAFRQVRMSITSFDRNATSTAFATVEQQADFARGSTGTPTGAVPEPATWAMMLAGFAITGVALRKRRATASA